MRLEHYALKGKEKALVALLHKARTPLARHGRGPPGTAVNLASPSSVLCSEMSFLLGARQRCSVLRSPRLRPSLRWHHQRPAASCAALRAARCACGAV